MIAKLRANLSALVEGPGQLVLHPSVLFGHVRDNSLHRNSIYMMAITVFSSLFGFVYWIAAARSYGAPAVGLAAAIISAMTLASLITNLGINTALVQVLPQRKSGEQWSATLNGGLVVGLSSSVTGSFIAILILPLISGRFSVLTASPLYLVTFVVGVVTATLTNLLDYACIAERAAGRMLVRNIVFSVVKVPLVIWPLIVGLSTLGILVSWVASSAVIALVMFVLLPGLGRGYVLSTAGLRAEIRRLSSFLAGHHAMNIGSFLPFWLLPVLVTARISSVANAHFYATWRVTGMLYMIAPAVVQSLAAEGASAPDQVWRKAISSARFVALLLMPASAVLVLVGPWILGVFGPGYESAGYPLLILFVVGAFPDAAMNLYTGILRVEGRLRLGGWLQLGTAAIALVTSWVLLPTLGISAAGAGWIISRFIGCLIVGIDRRRLSSPTKYPTANGHQPQAD